MKSIVNTDVLKTVQQERSPLSDMFFSEFNLDLLQKAIRQLFKDETGIAIDRQSDDDLLIMMRAVYVDNMMFPEKDVCSQVKFMNDIVIKMALSQIRTGVSQQIDYFRDASQLYQPNQLPVSTSLYGKKMDLNTKIGL